MTVTSIPSQAKARHIAATICPPPPPPPFKAIEIRLAHNGDVIVSHRIGEVYAVNVPSGGRKVKRFFHSEGDGEEYQHGGFGYKTARQAADALAQELGWAK